MEAQSKDYNLNVIRSVWRRLKKGHIKIRDLEPEKDVKGGASVADNRGPITSDRGGTGRMGAK